jgi:hypothetical protein
MQCSMQRSASQPSHSLPSHSLPSHSQPSHSLPSHSLPSHSLPSLQPATHAPPAPPHAPHHAPNGHWGGPGQRDGFAVPVERLVVDAALHIAAASVLCVDPREVCTASEQAA